MCQVVAAKLQKDGKEYYWKVPGGDENPKAREEGAGGVPRRNYAS